MGLYKEVPIKVDQFNKPKSGQKVYKKDTRFDLKVTYLQDGFIYEADFTDTAKLLHETQKLNEIGRSWEQYAAHCEGLLDKHDVFIREDNGGETSLIDQIDSALKTKNKKMQPVNLSRINGNRSLLLVGNKI